MRSILVYIAPGCSVPDCLRFVKAFSDFTASDGPTVLLGDFNLPGIDFPKKVRLGHLLIMSLLMAFANSSPSCQPEEIPYSILFFVIAPTLYMALGYLPLVYGASDHATVNFSLVVPHFLTSTTFIKDFKNTNYVAVGENLYRLVGLFHNLVFRE